MAIRTVGSGGDYAFTEAGLVAAIAACSNGDTVRLIQAGTITLTSALAPVAAITIEGDISLYSGHDKTTLPKLYATTTIRAIACWVSNINVKNLQFEGFLNTGSGNSGGVINGQGNTFGTLENLSFDNCVSCIQQGVGGTFRDIRATNVGRLMRSCTGPNIAVFEVVQRAGYDYVFDNGSDTTGVYALGAVYQDGSRTNHSVANLSGTGPTMRDISAYRTAGAGGTAFKGTYSYCTQTGYGTLGSGTDGGENYSRDPLFTDPANGNFTFQSSSLEIDSGTSISGVTTDMIGQTLPVGSGWPRGSRDLLVGTTVSSVTVVDQDTIKLNLAASVSSDSTWEDEGNFTITATGSGAAVAVTAAAITDAGMSITLTTSEHTDGEGYSIEWSGLTSIADDSDTYTGVGVDPTLSSVAVTGENSLRVTFSEPMATTDLETLGKYSVTPVVAGGPAVSVTAASREAGSNPTYVDLTISDAVAGKEYTLSIASGLTDKALNPLGAASGNFTSPSTTVASLSRTATTVTLTFDRPVLVGASHTAAENYSTTPSGGAAAVSVASAAVDDPTIASSVVLTTSEHTQGGSYLFAWDGLAHLADDDSAYTGVGVAPTLGTVVVSGVNSVRLPFSEAMATTGLETLGRYTIAPVTPGGPAITVSAVARESGSSPTYVDLTFSETIAGKAYRISVATGLTDKALNPLGAATAYFTAADTSLANIEVVSTTRIVATLARRALYDPDLVSTANWQIKRLDPQFGMTPTVVSVEVDDEDFPQELTITTTNHTAGQAYEITYVGP